jgi:hypothetical protein
MEILVEWKLVVWLEIYPSRVVHSRLSHQGGLSCRGLILILILLLQECSVIATSSASTSVLAAPVLDWMEI